ncbi:hypothetical protein QQF64_034296, partial [Cirrhinus molitorella]
AKFPETQNKTTTTTTTTKKLRCCLLKRRVKTFKQKDTEEQTDQRDTIIKMAFIKEESEDIKTEVRFRVKCEDTEEQTELMTSKEENQSLADEIIQFRCFVKSEQDKSPQKLLQESQEEVFLRATVPLKWRGGERQTDRQTDRGLEE